MSLVHLLRTGVRNTSKRKEICNKLIHEFAKGKSYWNRSLFLIVCVNIMKVFSRKFFKETFIEVILDMGVVSYFLFITLLILKIIVKFLSFIIFVII